MDHEFDYGNLDGFGPQHVSDAALSARLNGSGIPARSELDSAPLSSNIPLLTYGEEVNFINYSVSLFFFFRIFISTVTQAYVFFGDAMIASY